MSRLRKLGVIKDKANSYGSWQWTCNGEVTSSISYELNTLEWHAWIRVYYTNKNSGENHDYKIALTTTTPTYGGQRWWFMCPAKGCGRRVGVLFLGNIMACRHCYNLAYPSQNQEAHDRYTDQAFALARKIGLEGNVIDGFYGKKPKGMHRKKFNRLRAKVDDLSERGMYLAIAKFGNMF